MLPFLNSATTCSHCGGLKKIKHAFCDKCFAKLSPAVQKALYKPVRKGFEQGLEDAKKELKCGK